MDKIFGSEDIRFRLALLYNMYFHRLYQQGIIPWYQGIMDVPISKVQPNYVVELLRLHRRRIAISCTSLFEMTDF